MLHELWAQIIVKQRQSIVIMRAENVQGQTDDKWWMSRRGVVHVSTADLEYIPPHQHQKLREDGDLLTPETQSLLQHWEFRKQDSSRPKHSSWSWGAARDRVAKAMTRTRVDLKNCIVVMRSWFGTGESNRSYLGFYTYSSRYLVDLHWRSRPNRST